VSFETLPTGKPLGLAYLCGLACFALVAGLLFGAPALAIPSKLLASTAFIAVALTAGALDSRYGRVLLVGLVLSWFGDAFLISETKQWFLFGLVSFLLAHVAYVIAFAISGIDRRWAMGALVPVTLIAVLVSMWLAPHLSADMVWPVRAYTIVIMAFGTLGAGATPLIVAGACLFYLSDLSVAAMRFTDPLFPTYVLGLPLYYAGQLCLALSVATGQRETTADN
jgi:uncharacterized membrane protein YhhN